MKKQNITGFMTLSLTLFLIFLFSETAAAQTFNGPPCEVPSGFCKALPSITIPPSFSANSIAFNAPNLGTLFVQFSAETYLNTVGKSKYRVSLRKGLPNANLAIASGEEVAVKEVINGAGEFVINIDNCNKTGFYYLRFTNTSTDNPQVGKGFAAYYAPPAVKRELEADPTNYPLSLDSGVETGRTLGLFPKPGKLHLYAKWNVFGITPTYAKLRISLIRPDGTIALAAKDYWSYHYREGSPRFQNVTYQVTKQDANLAGEWRLKILNISQHNITGFNIRKGRDLNPTMSDYKSYFTNGCGS